MTRNKDKIAALLVVALTVGGVYIHFTIAKHRQKERAMTKIIRPVKGDVLITVSTTGTVAPQNRLEIKPSMSGRIEEVLVKEGDAVKTGEVLARMSSTERAALVDAARSEGKETQAYWEDVYKMTPLVSPIDGEVIVRAVEPGQTVASTDSVLVVSDRLVISAQFDETDIGRVKVGQRALVSLDAYPEVKLEGEVGQIAYESKVVNNVTIYDCDILPKETPEILRSGMSVTVNVVEQEARGVVTIPSAAIRDDGKRKYVLVSGPLGTMIERSITIGLNNEKTAEVLSGLTEEDGVIVQESFLPKKKNAGRNPFMPSGRR